MGFWEGGRKGETGEASGCEVRVVVVIVVVVVVVVVSNVLLLRGLVVTVLSCQSTRLGSSTDRVRTSRSGVPRVLSGVGKWVPGEG